MTPKHNKKPRKASNTSPPAYTPRKAQDPNIFNTNEFCWRVSDKFIDYDDEKWGWGNVQMRDFFHRLLPRLQEYETMRWDELFRRQSCHAWIISDLPKDAQRKLRKKYPELDTFHQVDMEQPCRLLGFRDRQDFYLIWHDPNHDICPLQK